MFIGAFLASSFQLQRARHPVHSLLSSLGSPLRWQYSQVLCCPTRMVDRMLPQFQPCLPTTSVPASLLWNHPILALACAYLDAFASSQPKRPGALGLCGCSLGMRAFCRMHSLSAAGGMTSRAENQLCAPTCPYLWTLGQAFGQFLPVLPGLPISSPCPTPCTPQGLPLLISMWSQATCWSCAAQSSAAWFPAWDVSSLPATCRGLSIPPQEPAAAWCLMAVPEAWAELGGML